MYKIGDKVMHRQEGACFIRQIVDMKMNNETKKYYLLVPMLNLKTNVYVSMDRMKQKNIRPVIRLNEYQAAQLKVKHSPQAWDDDSKRRILSLTKIMLAFDFQEVLLTLSCLQEQNEKKKLSSRESEILKAAQRLIYSEIAIILNLDYDVVAASPEKYIMHNAYSDLS